MMKRIAAAGVMALCITSGPVHSAAADDPVMRYQQARQTYLEALRRGAEEHLQDVYENTGTDARARIPRKDIQVQIRTGADRVCFSTFKVGYLLSQENVIVVCEEDVSASADYLFGWLLLTGAALKENPELFKTASASGLDKPLPDEVNRQWKARALQLAQYLADSNKRIKEARFVKQVSGPSPCRAWEAAYRIIHAPSSLAACTRNTLSPQESEQAVRWGLETLMSVQKTSLRLSGTQKPEQQAPSVPLAQAEAAMNEARSQFMDRFIYYVVAHEFGHIINTATEGKMTPREQELAADRFAASAINTFMARAVVLPYLALSLEVLWSTTKDPAVLNRAESLSTVVFCERKGQLRAQGTTPILEQLIRNMAGDCP